MKYVVLDHWDRREIEEFDSQEEAEKAAEFLNHADLISIGYPIYSSYGRSFWDRFGVGTLAE